MRDLSQPEYLAQLEELGAATVLGCLKYGVGICGFDAEAWRRRGTHGRRSFLRDRRGAFSTSGSILRGSHDAFATSIDVSGSLEGDA